MADDEELQMALRLSMQPASPESKRSKSRDGALESPPESSGSVEEPLEAKIRRLQRELMAAAAEKRMLGAMPVLAVSPKVEGTGGNSGKREGEFGALDCNLGRELLEEEASQLFSVVFGSGVSKDILAQWSNQGIKFSADPETALGLVQHEGGPCGVLAAIQAFVLKYILFFPNELGVLSSAQNLSSRRLSKSQCVASNDFSSLSETAKQRALVRSMSEILFLCGSNERAVIATLSVTDQDNEGSRELNDEIVAKTLEGLSIESCKDLQKVLRVEMYTSQAKALQRLEAVLPVFQSRMGAMLFLISALISRGLDSVQADRDDPILPLVTAPFGHASQEIVNLLLCGQAVANVFDGSMDLGGGMFLKGISTSVEVGFLTLLESLHFCKVGQNLKSPKWPIWVVGSESHYTVLFALDTSVQDENEMEQKESQIRKAFDAHDQSGGGGFISAEGFHDVLREVHVQLPVEKLDHLCCTGFIVWSEFWQVILDLDKNLGGLKDSTGLMGKKVFDLYHFNGIAKSVSSGSQATLGGETPIQRPRLIKLRVSVPPRWTPEEFMTELSMSSSSGGGGHGSEVNKPQPGQHAPLADCIRTRWPRAVCSWVGDPPSIV